MRRLPGIWLLLWLFSPALPADFSASLAMLHPAYPGAGPYIIEISGTWPNDCHPGEQKPVVRAYDGRAVVVEFDIIVVHVTCNPTDTDYRVLVDMSERVSATPPTGDRLHVTVRFQGAMLEQELDLVCAAGAGCPESGPGLQGPEAGLYTSRGLARQGLLVARQNEATVIYPLTYDESGASEWLFAGNRLVGDAYFSELFRLSGGDCFGCDPTGSEPQMTSLGRLSVLVDRPDTLQVKLNDGLFRPYERLVYGYRTFAVGPAGEQTLVDLHGRWAISENHGTDPPLGDLTELLPAAFDVELEGYGPPADPPADSPANIASASYLVTTLTGDPLGQLICAGWPVTGPPGTACQFIDPTDAADPLFLFYQTGPDSLDIEYGRPTIAVGIPPGGRAVRLD